MTEKNYNLAFVFPGQGSQAMGMLSELAINHAEVETVFTQASEVIGHDLWQIVCQGPEAVLNQTQFTQPAMLSAGVAVWQIWCKQNPVRPAWMAGHSLGEYTALVCANAIAFKDAIRLVYSRGKLMQEAVPDGTGAMAAILGLEDHDVVNICHETAGDEVVSAVNFNAPGQVVIAGHRQAVERAINALKQAGAKKTVMLPVSVPSHCALMKPAAEKLMVELENIQINPPDVALIHNVDVSSHTAPEVIRNALKEQLYKPVRWVDSIKFMHEQGVDCFVECGPGKVLIGLNKRIIKDANHLSIFDNDTLATAQEQFND